MAARTVEFVVQAPPTAARPGPAHAASMASDGAERLYVSHLLCDAMMQRQHRVRRGTAEDVTCRRCRAVLRKDPES